MFIIAPNYHKTQIKSVALTAHLSHSSLFNWLCSTRTSCYLYRSDLYGSFSRGDLSILEKEAEEVVEIHRDSYLCRLCDMTFLKISELRQKIAELEYFSSSLPDLNNSR